MRLLLMVRFRETFARRVKMLTMVWMLAEEFDTLSVLFTVALLRASTNAGKVLASRFWVKKQNIFTSTVE